MGRGSRRCLRYMFVLGFSLGFRRNNSMRERERERERDGYCIAAAWYCTFEDCICTPCFYLHTVYIHDIHWESGLFNGKKKKWYAMGAALRRLALNVCTQYVYKVYMHCIHTLSRTKTRIHINTWALTHVLGLLQTSLTKMGMLNGLHRKTILTHILALQ